MPIYRTSSNYEFSTPEPGVVARGTDKRFFGYVAFHFTTVQQAVQWREEAPAERTWEHVTLVSE